MTEKNSLSLYFRLFNDAILVGIIPGEISGLFCMQASTKQEAIKQKVGMVKKDLENGSLLKELILQEMLYIIRFNQQAP